MKKIYIIATLIFVAIISGIFLINIYEAETEVTKETTKVGVVLNGRINDQSWSQSHYEGLEQTAKELNLSIFYEENVTVENIDTVIYTPIISDKSYFKDTFIIEVARGCMNRCAFCTASYLNLPFRTYEYERIINTIDLGLKHTNKIALLGAQISAHPDFERIMEYIDKELGKGRAEQYLKNAENGLQSQATEKAIKDIEEVLING